MRNDKDTYGFSKGDANELVQLIGGRDREHTEGKVRGNGGGGGDEIFLFTLTGAVSSGTGTATIRNKSDSAEIGTGETLEDPLGHFDGIAVGARGACVKNGSNYMALGPYVISVDWNDPDLTYDRGSTAVNIDTAEDCGVSDVDGGTL